MTVQINNTFSSAGFDGSWTITAEGTSSAGYDSVNGRATLVTPSTINVGVRAVTAATYNNMEFTVDVYKNSASVVSFAGAAIMASGTWGRNNVIGLFPQNGIVLSSKENGSTINLQQFVAGVATTLTFSPAFTWSAGTGARIKMKYAGGTTLQVKIYAIGGTEPAYTNITVASMSAGSAAVFNTNGTSTGAVSTVGIDNVVLDDLVTVINASYTATATQIDVAAQSAIASIPKSFTATAATVSIDAPTPAVSAINNIQYGSTVSQISVVVPNHTVFAKHDIVEPAPVYDISVASGDHTVHAVKNVSFTAQSTAINVVAGDAKRNTSTIISYVNQDSYVDVDNPNALHGDDSEVLVKAWSYGDTGKRVSAFFNFPITVGRQNVNKAVLTFKVTQSTNVAYWGLYAITSPWDESTLTWNNSPTLVDLGDANAGEYYTAGNTYSIDVTKALAAGIYGFAISNRNISVTQGIASSESANPPYLTLTYEVNPVSVTVNAPVDTISIAAPTPAVTLSTNRTVNADAVTINLDASGADVFATDTVSFLAGTAQIDVSTLDARGGTPDRTVTAEVADVTILTPNNAYGFGATDITINASVTDVTINTLPATVSNITDVVVYAEAIGVRIKLVGFYNRDEDKWADFVENSLLYPDDLPGTGDSWFTFDEQPGATQSISETGVGVATYYGNPTLRAEAPDSRSAVSLDGVDDYILLGLDGTGQFNNDQSIAALTRPHDKSLEIILRTTATSGIIFSGNGLNLEVGPDGLFWSRDVQTQNGYTFTSNEQRIPIPNSKINDGEWHQIVFFFNDGVDLEYTTGRSTLVIDGEVIWSRFGWTWIVAQSFINTIGRRNLTTLYADRTTLPTRYLKADIMSAVFRMWESYNRAKAQRSWYIFAGYTLVDAGAPADISVTTPNAKGKGNQKKMLVLYGNGEFQDQRNGVTYNVYYSSWSGISVPGQNGMPFGPNEYTDRFNYVGLPTPVSIDFRGYKLYFAHMYKPSAGNTPGVVNNTGEDYYYDNISGEPRYIDVNTDLAMDIEDFDVVHVLHWPASNMTDTDASDNLPVYLQADINEFNYDTARGIFKKSLRKAVDKGVGLWIAQAEMAIDFGIAKGYDVHQPERDPKGNIGTKAMQRDLALAHSALGIAGGSQGDYDDTYFVDKRRIVGTTTGFSETPTWVVDEYIYWKAYDQLRAHPDMYAQNLRELPNGLVIGEHMPIYVEGRNDVVSGYRSQDKHYSLRPDGIVGLVIAKEQETFFRGLVEVPNPYADYVTTVLVERGTILEGSPIRGRIFVELMDNSSPVQVFRHATIARNYLNGSNESPDRASQWDYDTRRNKEVFMYNSNFFFKGDVRYQGDDIPYISDPTSLPVVAEPYVGMNDRGLAWLSIKPDVAFGNNVVYAAAVDVAVSAVQPVVGVVKNNTVTAQPATIKIEARQPSNFHDADVRVNADAMEITIIGGNYQTIVHADVTDIFLSAPLPTVKGEGEDFVMHLRSNDFTLYLGEDY